MQRWTRLGCRGQSFVEYALVMLVVILALIALSNGAIRTAINRVVIDSAARMTSASGRINTP